MSTELTVQENRAPAIMENLLQAVTEKQLSLEALEKFMDLAERNEKREAEKAYHKAFAEFKANPPEIMKDRHVKYGNTNYNHASIGNVVTAIISGMSQHGLSHKWFLNQDGNNITVSCQISHFMGHSETTSISAAADQSGGKNAIQAIGSTITYLQRYTLQAATGIAVLENDDDGAGANDVKPPAPKEKESDIYAKWVDEADKAAKVGYENLGSWYKKSKPERDKLPPKVLEWVNGYVKELKDAMSEQPTKGNNGSKLNMEV